MVISMQPAMYTQTQVLTGNSYSISATTDDECERYYRDRGITITVSVTGYYKEEETVLVEDLDNDSRKSFIEWHSRKLSSKQPVRPYRNMNRKLLKIRSRLR